MNIKLLGVASVLLVAFCIPVTTLAASPQVTGNTTTIAELMQQISALQVQIEELKADLANTKQELAVVREEIWITKTLKLGMSDAEVKKLQEFLSTMPDIYPEGLVTGYFGALTERAVKKWQEGNGIESVGVVGPKTRAKLSEVTSSNVMGGTTPAIPAVPTSESGVATVPANPAQPGENRPTVTPSGTVPATPAQPIGQTGVTTVPATPAQSAVDTTAPTISSIQATNITQTTANISWTTNEVSTSDVYYARNSSVLTNGTLHASVIGNVTSHSITLSNLVTYSGYYYLVVSKDEAGNTATSSVYMFVSLMEPMVTPTTRTITATAGTGGTISPDGSVVVTQGTNKTFTVTPNAGYNISAVTVDGANQGAIGTYTFTNVQTAHSISATFAQITYAISVTQGLNGTISPGTTSVVSGGGQAFAIAPATGYQIASVSVDGVNQGAISTYAFTNAQAAHTITATYSLLPVAESCSLTVSLSASTQAAQYVYPGQSAVSLVKFNATPNCSGTLNSFAVSLLPMPNGYQNISALRLYNDTNGVQLGTSQAVAGASVNFASVNTSLTANQALVLSLKGDVSPSASVGSTVYGTFGGSSAVTGTGGAIGNNASGNLIMGNTMTVAATPVVQYSITITQGANGTISPGTTSVTSGGSQTFSIIPASGYQILSVTVDGASQGAISSYAFSNVQASHTLSASFTAIPSNLPIPTEFRVGFGIMSGVSNWVKISESLNFQFDINSLANVSAFRLYQKKPQDSSFTMVGEFSNPSGLTTCSTKRTYGTWTLTSLGGGPTGCPGSGWHVSRTSAYPVSSYEVGDYYYYVTAVNTSGVEGSNSLISVLTLLGSFPIQAPITVETSGTLNPTFHWQPASGSSQGISYWVIVAPSDGSGSQVMLTPFYSSGPNIAKVYDGPALTPGKQYSVWIYGRAHNSLQTEDQSAYASEVATFSVADLSSVGTNPRIMYWSGKVNQHTDASGNWVTDPDGVSGADLDKLTYCKKFYPDTTNVEDYMLETTDTWRNRGNVDGPFTSTKMSTKCLQPTIASRPVNSQIANVLDAMQGILNQIRALLK